MLGFSFRDLVVVSQPLLTGQNRLLGSRLSGFRKDLGDDDRVRVYSVDDPPSLRSVLNAQLVTAGTNGGHWSRVR